MKVIDKCLTVSIKKSIFDRLRTEDKAAAATVPEAFSFSNGSLLQANVKKTYKTNKAGKPGRIRQRQVYVSWGIASGVIKEIKFTVKSLILAQDER